MPTRLKKRRTGFKTRHLTVRRGPSAAHYLSKPVTFWIAVMSLFAFVSGNMVGQHGWFLFWNSVWGVTDDSLIAYSGTTSPIALIPDPVKWAKYGGDQRYHTFAQAPKDVLIPLPSYMPVDQIPENDVVRNRLYSVDFAGTYATGGGQGSHAGIDIAAPQGTPVSAVMNGIVIDARSENGGFGKYVLIRHPNVPDPKNPSKTTTLFTLYAHMDAYVVDKGTLVNKGQVIGTVGKTGDATGFHLHFQMNYNDAETLWPFTWSELRTAGLSFSQGIDQGFKRDVLLSHMVNPMQYVQARYAPVAPVIAQATSKSSSSRMTVAERAAARRSRATVADVRVVALAETTIVKPVVQSPLISSSASAVSNTASSSSAASSAVSSTAKVATAIAEAYIDVPFDFGQERTWQKVRITLRDAEGETIRNPILERPLALRTAFGKADFRPSVLTAAHFKNGTAEVEILPFGQSTVVVELYPLNTLSKPIRFAGR